MNNLLDNSLRFTSNNHPFVIHGSLHHNSIQILVTDGGSLRPMILKSPIFLIDLLSLKKTETLFSEKVVV